MARKIHAVRNRSRKDSLLTTPPAVGAWQLFAIGLVDDICTSFAELLEDAEVGDCSAYHG
jgi:hypothetical protein